MHDDPTLAAVLPTLSLTPRHGPWARVMALRHLQGPPPGAPAGGSPQPLWPGGGGQKGGRFTPLTQFGGFDTIYLATEPMTALAEVEAVFETGNTFAYQNHLPYAVFCVEGIVADVLDLTDPTIQAALGTTDQALRGPWRRGQGRAVAQAKAGAANVELPPTQRLARAAYTSGRIGGLLYPSARINGAALPGTNLVVFTDRLAANALTYLEIVTEGGLYAQRLP